jgi:integrase
MASRKQRGRGEGSVYYDATKGRWVGSVSLPPDGAGRRRRRKVMAKTKGEAQERLRKLQHQADTGQLPEAGNLTVGQFLKRWLDSIRGRVAAGTILTYEHQVNRYIVPYAGRLPLAKLTVLHVEKLYSDWSAANEPPAMQRKAATTFGVGVQHAVRLRLVPHNVVRDVPKPRHTPAEARPLDPGEVHRFLAAATGERLYALYAVAIDSAAREGELFGLLWADVDFDGSAITITKSLSENNGKIELKEVKTKKSRRRVALSTFALEALAEHRRKMLAEGHYGPDRPVFCNRYGTWLRKTSVQQWSFRRVLRRAGLERVRFYDLRHSGATLLLLAGEDSKVVAERLGHSTTRLTQDTYQHVLPGMQERAAAKLDAIFRAGEKDAV